MEVNVNNVSYTYLNVGKNACVLKDINMSIKEGKITGIVGRTGSGKTTLLEMIEALRLPTKGNIKIGDYVLEKDKKIENINDLRFNVGLVFQTPEEQFFNFTVQEELELGMRFFGYKLQKLDKRVIDALIMVGLDESYLSKNPLNLSNGEKRKVALASILIFNPEILVLDEPTIGLDDENKKAFIRLIRTLKQRYNKTIIIASHDTEMLHKIVDYVYVIDNKKIVLEGTKYEVFKQVKLLKKYGIKVPKVIEFSDKVLTKKNVKIGYRDEINDLIKDIYRYVR